jgi:class 3 adenylate cyclase
MQRRTSGRGLAAVLFTDVVGSTAIAAEMGNTRWAELVARHHRIVRREIGRFGGREIDTAGDGFFVTFERPADAIRCAVAAAAAVRELGIEIRAGVSFGELETVGRKPGGLAVNTAARVMSVGGPGEVLVPASVREIVSGSGITFADHGVHRLKGLEGEFRLSSVTGVDGAGVAPPLEAEQAAARRRDIFPAGAKRTALIAGLAAGGSPWAPPPGSCSAATRRSRARVPVRSSIRW